METLFSGKLTLPRLSRYDNSADNTRVTVNGKPDKASYDVKVGDHISIAFGARTVTVEVLAVAEAVRKDDATAMYREV